MLTIREVIRTLYNALNQKLKGHRGNWEQDDPTADDYIKNRPFYTDKSVRTEIVPEQKLDMSSSPYAKLVLPKLIEFEVGKTYEVEWDGETYICTAGDMDGTGYIGDGNILNGGSTGEPFLMAINNNAGYGIVLSIPGAIHIVKVDGIKVVTLDKRYLPDLGLAPVATSNNYWDLDGVPETYSDVVRYGASQNLTVAQKNTATSNIASVSYESQSLTDVQKTQARTNIGAVSSDDITGVVKYSTGQSLTDGQKEIARNNIGASDFSGNYEDLVGSPRATYKSFFGLNHGVSPKSITRLKNDTFDYICFDFGTNFVASTAYYEFVNNYIGSTTGSIHLRGESYNSTGSVHFGYDAEHSVLKYIATNIAPGFGTYNSQNGSIVFFTFDGRVILNEHYYSDKIINDFENEKCTITFYLPDLVNVCVVDESALPFAIYKDVVRYNIAQSLSDEQKNIARYNIGAFDGDYNKLTNKPTGKNVKVFSDESNYGLLSMGMPVKYDAEYKLIPCEGGDYFYGMVSGSVSSGVDKPYLKCRLYDAFEPAPMIYENASSELQVGNVYNFVANDHTSFRLATSDDKKYRTMRVTEIVTEHSIRVVDDPVNVTIDSEEKPYTLTETITLAEAINSKTLTFTEDADSYQLALSCPAAEAALGLSVEVYTADGLVAYMWMAGMIDTTAKYAKCSMYRAHGEWVFESMQPVNNENQTSAVSRNPKFVSAEKPITKIVIYASGGGMMPSGTTIEVRSY